MSPAQHSNNFNFVRLLAALCVVVSHQFALSGLPEPTLLGLHSLGGVGVLIFFSLSGYLVAQSWDADPHLLRFAARRLLRVWPGLAVVTLLTALVWGPLVSHLPPHEYFHDASVRRYLGALGFQIRDSLPVRFEGNALPTAVNGPLWTIPLELQCYVALAVLGAAGLLRSRLWSMLIALALVFVYAVVEPRGDLLTKNMGWSLEQRFLLEFGLFFAAGVVLHFLGLEQRRRFTWAIVGSCWVLGLVAIVLARPLLGLWLILPCTVIAIGTASTPYIRRAGRFGDLSYGVYIYAFPIQQTLIWWYGKTLPAPLLFGLVLLTVGCFAFASWHLIEKRALQFKPRSRRATVPSSAAGAAAGKELRV